MTEQSTGPSNSDSVSQIKQICIKKNYTLRSKNNNRNSRQVVVTVIL